MSTQKNRQYPGKLVAFEGIEHAGKTAIIGLLPDFLSGAKVPVVICGERKSPIGPLLHDEYLKTYSAFLKTYLFATDRAWTYEKTCLPALRRGALVLWDRYVDSAVAYRSAELKRKKSAINLDFVRQINAPFMKPDLTIYLDLNIRVAKKRQRRGLLQIPYSLTLIESVRREYLRLARANSYAIVNANRPRLEVVNDVASRIMEKYSNLFGSKKS